MRRTIWKFLIPVGDYVVVQMPAGANVLHVATQGSSIHVWASVDPDAKLVPRSFSVRGTGHSCDGLERARYVGTVHLPDRALVFHVFDWRDG